MPDTEFTVHSFGEALWLSQKLPPPCTWDIFDKAPEVIECQGHTFQKRSYTYDGILYRCGEEPFLTATVPLIEAVGQWTREVFTTATPHGATKRAIQECEELLEVLKYWPPTYELYKDKYASPNEIKAHIGSEIADVLHCIIDVGAQLGIDVTEALRQKLEVNKARTWSEPDENNQRYHVKAT